MDLLLLLLTSLSLAAAIGFGLLAVRVRREDRRRSAARVAVLSSAIDRPGQADLKVRLYEDGSLNQQADLDRQADLKVRLYGDGSLMFGRPTGAGIAGRPVLKAAVAGVMLVVVGIAFAMSGGSAERPRAAQAGSPLELMSLTSARDGRTLTVTGLVRNPPSGSEVRRVTAVVFAFDRTGGFVASGRAPLDFTVLDPDDESPFVVAIPNVGDVARYRVSFRTESGVIRHVDRRTPQSQLARSQ